MEKKEDNIVFSRDYFIRGIAATLKNFENDSVVHVSSGKKFKSGINVRNDDIFIDGERVFHARQLRNDVHLDECPSDDTITIDAAFDMVEPLYNKYPYLEIIMKKVVMDLFLDDDNDIFDKMVDAAVWYESYMPYTEQILSLVKTRNK